MEFLTKNWIALLSLLIAAFGGVPGFVTLYTKFKERPVLRYSLARTFVAQIENGETKKRTTVVMLTGTVSNEGAVAIIPESFEVKWVFNGKPVKLLKWLIPEGLTLPTNKQNIGVIEPAKNDLQRYTSNITQTTPLRGHLSFLAPDISDEELRAQLDDYKNKLKLTLACIDVFGKRHEAPVEIEDLHDANNSDIVYPNHGIVRTGSDAVRTK